MTLSPKLGVVGISTLWYFRLPLPIQMFIKVASSPRLSGIGMPSPILWSHPLKMQRIVLLSSLLWWELGTNSLITGPGEWLSFRRFTSKLSWSWCKNVFFLNIFRTNGWMLINYCVYIFALVYTRSMLYLMHVIFGQRLTELWPLIDQILHMHLYWQDVDLDAWTIFFVHFSTELRPLIGVEISFMFNIVWINWWILIKFCKCIDIDKM